MFALGTQNMYSRQNINHSDQDIDRQKRLEMLGLILISMFGPDGKFKPHVRKIREFITEHIELIGSEGPNDQNIGRLKQLGSLFDYYIEAENLNDFIHLLKRSLNKSKLDQDKGTEFHAKTYQWFSKYPLIAAEILKKIENDDEQSYYADYLKSISQLYFTAMEDSAEIVEVVDSVVLEIEVNDDQQFWTKFLYQYYKQ